MGWDVTHSHSKQGKKVVIQGFGNVGYWAAKFFEEEGAKVIGIGEYNGGVVCEEGLDIDALFLHWTNKRTFEVSTIMSVGVLSSWFMHAGVG